MKKLLVLFFLCFLLSGCATYKFQKQDTSSNSGYVASYYGKVISEYTIGNEKSFPDLALAQERFKRRRVDVEYYYRKMGQIENRFKEMFWDPPVMIVDFFGGILRWPFIAIADYKYNRNPDYKARVDKLDEEKDALEKVRQDNYKARLQAYILTDLKQEPSQLEKLQAVTPEVESVSEIVPAAPIVNEVVPKVKPAPVLEPVTPQVSATAVAPKEEIVSTPAALTPVVAKTETLVPPVQEAAPVISQVQEVQPPVVIEPVVEAKPIVKPILAPPVAVITAKPAKGPSPLTVKFSGQKSYSKSGKIIAYDWSFGDGDTSNKKSPTNIYYSTTFGSRPFTVTLTVKDEAGNSSSTSTTIELLNN